jgi:uncharacterized protein YdbL (DUF1318 family)
MPKPKYIVLLVLLAISSLGLTAAGAASLKERFIQRLPVIQELKQKGIVGENNQGFLAYRTNDKAHQDVVDAENADRLKVYQAIAKQQKTTVEVVGQRRALQIAQKTQKGEWLQAADGKWYRK